MKAGQSKSLCFQPQWFSDGCRISALIWLHLTKQACVCSDSSWKVNSFPILLLPHVALHMRSRTGLWEEVSPCLKNSGWESWGFPLQPDCLGMQNCSISRLYFSPRVIQTQHMTRHSVCLNRPSPWLLAPLNPPARKPFFGNTHLTGTDFLAHKSSLYSGCK